MPTPRRQSTSQNMRGGTRRILFEGPPGSGKSTYSASASNFAGDNLPLTEPVVCKDVAVIQGDNEGMVGARSCGLEIPNIFDMTNCASWDEYKSQLTADLKELGPMVASGEIKFLIVDLGFADTLLQSQVKPAQQKDWGIIRFESMMFFKAFSRLVGATIIGNCQIKASEAPGELVGAANAATAKAIGGERSTFCADLSKGMGQLWKDNVSLLATVERTLTRDPVTKQKSAEVKVYTQPNGKFEAKSRFGNVLKPVESGAETLNSLLRRCYGENL